MSATDDVEPLLEYLKRQRGFDFTGYKRSSLERRIAKRMEEVGVGAYSDYQDHLEVHQDEFALLFNTVLINVTAFFRDTDAWAFLAEETIPRLLRENPQGPLRVWCAGCSSGQETYTVAILLAEALGEAAYMERVKIYATDVDDEALDAARAGTFAAKDVEGVPEAMLTRYFDRSDTRYAFRKDLRRSIIFGRNDLVQDAPISRIDLLVCRNTLMYFNAETQSLILRRFHFALRPTGFLLMGKSEMLITHADLFRPIDLKCRVFGKVAKRTVQDRLLDNEPVAAVSGAPPTGEDGSRLRDGAFDASTNAELLVGRDGILELANRQARELLGVREQDIGRPLKDLEVSYKPVELRSHLDRTWKSRREVEVLGVQLTPDDGAARTLDLRVLPLADAQGVVLGATVTFVDVTAQAELRAELEESKRELEASYEELQSTVEELETTNEELQSTNEELETTNEELQSTNEELETMNEELQSTNEELETINEELRQRSHQLDEVNAFLETILTSLGLGVVVVDRRLRVRIWNDQSADLWGLRSEEAEGENLLGLDIGLPTEQLKQDLRATVDGNEERTVTTVQATNRRGRKITCEVTTLPLRDATGEINGAILMVKAD